ncbi:hypothetical protein EV361DRAFT_872342 [Lentinula raphanica]|uniref:Uncharacterized protein n=1 Tax=Lentinula raphanica TaxID=153919 RepID=A0AA38P143_9AGAR|nr:hypothetical protein F5880DRAFT_1510895 [Lentinula raphanica]KAJ3834364.1 hypothetical protein F5878DRAFT_645189 [Lentinula raphanica]KAJ3966506.1 hypothetical protein EV361DRAFT_872342 [Lentinula raphanica]
MERGKLWAVGQQIIVVLPNLAEGREEVESLVSVTAQPLNRVKDWCIVDELSSELEKTEMNEYLAYVTWKTSVKEEINELSDYLHLLDPSSPLPRRALEVGYPIPWLGSRRDCKERDKEDVKVQLTLP